MRFAIVGPGALGCLVVSKLTEGAAATGDSLWVLDHDPSRAAHIRREGIVCEKAGQQHRYQIAATANPEEIDVVDAVFLCVKSYNVGSALEFCGSLLREGSLLIFMQNGIGHLEFRDRVGKAVPAFGCTSEGATYLGPGHIRHAGEGRTFLGFLDPVGEVSRGLLARTASRLQAGGLNVSVEDNILTRLWAKLFVNVGINALTVIHDCRNGDLLAIDDACRDMQAAVAEAGRVARAKGIAVENDPFQTTVAVCRATAGNISSMRQDVMKRRRTEIEAINGAVVKEAARLRIATPVNESLVRRIKEIETGYVR